MLPGQPEFIARGGEVAWRGPCGFTNATLYGFVIKADPNLVHEMLTRYIREPSQDLGELIDVTGTTLDRVLFVFLDSDRHQMPTLPGRGSEGRFRERLFAIVVLGYRRWPDPGLVTFVPYIFTSETPGWKGDREIYGFPLQHGLVSIQEDGELLPCAFSVNARVIDRFAESAIAKDTTFLCISRKGNASQQSALGSQARMARMLSALKARRMEPLGPPAAAIVPHPRLGVTTADAAFFERFRRSPGHREPDRRPMPPLTFEHALRSGLLPMLFLKQFRDILFADRACYQAIVEAPFEISGKIAAIGGQEYVLELKDCDSVPLRRELGIPSGDVRVDFGFRIDVERLSMGDAKVISNPEWSPAVEIATPDEPSRLPRYIERGGEAVWRQPSLLYGARIYGFGVMVPSEQQEATLKRYINDVSAASHSTYGSRTFCLRPCEGIDVVMLMFVEYDRITSGNELDRRLGGTSYLEFVVMQLAISDDPEFPELDWFIPYICLDTDAPRLGGREIFGYPKQLGTIEPIKRYDGLETVEELVLRTTVIRNFSRKSADLGVPVVRVQGPPTPPATTRYTNALEMFLDLARAGGAPLTGRLFPLVQRGGTTPDGGILARGPGVEIMSALLNARVGDVFLKEFRDCLNPELACYQAVCKTDTLPAKFHGGALVDPSGYRITIGNLASEPVLGHVLGEGGAVDKIYTPVFAYELDLDLELTAGRVIANPLAADYPHAPETSLRSTKPEAGARPSKRRVAPFTEPHWMK
jgi:hypothetical protein